MNWINKSRSLSRFDPGSRYHFFAFHTWTGGSLIGIFPRQAATLFHLGRVPYQNFIDTWEPILVKFRIFLNFPLQT
jgi:hypothetical protein